MVLPWRKWHVLANPNLKVRYLCDVSQTAMIGPARRYQLLMAKIVLSGQPANAGQVNKDNPRTYHDA